MQVSHDEHLITAVCDELWIIKDRKVHQSKARSKNMTEIYSSHLPYFSLRRAYGQGDFQEYKEEVLSSIGRSRRP
jgi:ATPase subunit of ABC transporter with duplicated ATPase domains